MERQVIIPTSNPRGKAMILRHVVVTGANGFIGNHVCRRLVESGKEVTACIRAQADASLLAAIPGPSGRP